MDKGAILLKDLVGEKSESVLVSVFRIVAGRSSAVNVPRGELVEQIPVDGLTPRNEGQKPYNYRVKKDPAVLLYCHEQDIAPLGDKEFLLLEAIQTPAARYEMFISGEKMDWGCRLKPGDTVYVNIPSLTVLPSCRAAAVVCYVGGLIPEPGLKFGIKITVRWLMFSLLHFTLISRPSQVFVTLYGRVGKHSYIISHMNDAG